MKLECIQKVIDSLEVQKERPFAVILSPKNFKALMDEMNQANIIISNEPTMLFGLRIEGWPYFPEDSILCVTKDGYEKLIAKPKMEDLILKPPIFVDDNVIPDKEKVLEWYKKIEELLKKEITMQEIMKDDSTGEVHVENTIEDLVRHIKKSLANPDVKYVKIFRGKTLKDEKRFTAEEEKKDFFERTFKEPGEEVKPK